MDSINCSILDSTPEDIAILLAAKCHLGTTNITPEMKNYVYTRRADGTFIININKTWEKLMLAARVLASVKESTDIYITSSSVRGRRPATNFSMFLNTIVNIGRFSPGTLTKSIVEPQLLVCLDPYDDIQAISESSRCCIPVISFVNSDSSLKYVDIAIPCNTAGSQSIGVMCYLLTRAVLRLRGKVDYTIPWRVIPDMFFHTDEIVLEEADEGNAYASFDKEENGEVSWPGGGEGKFRFAEDDGINRQNDNPKPDWMANSSIAGKILGDIASSLAASNEPIDWAEDTPQVNVETNESQGWDASASNNNKTWQESTKSPWDE